MNPYIADSHHVWNRSRCKYNDTIALARFRAPDLPKGLGVIGTILTDVHNWKNDHDGNKIATKGQDDGERLDYCHLDVAVNVEIVEPLTRAAENAGAFRPLNPILRPSDWPSNRPWNLYEFDSLRQELAVEAHRRGVLVDQDLRYRMEVLLTAEVKYHYDELQKLAREVGLKSLDGIASDEDDVEDDDERADRDAIVIGASAADVIDAANALKPGSTDNIRHLLYDVWGLKCPPMLTDKEYLTDSGLPSTSDVVLRGHLANPTLTKLQRAFLTHLRQYRRKRNKGLGTILIPLRLRSLDKKRGLVWPDGRVRSTFGTLITAVGRWNSRRPNLQNIGSKKGAGVWFDVEELARRFNMPMNGGAVDYDEIGKWKYAWKKYVDGSSNDFDTRYLDARCDYTDTDKFRRHPKTGKILVPFKDLFITEDDQWCFGFDLDAIHMVIIANEWKIPAVVGAYRDGNDFHNTTAFSLGRNDETGRNDYVDADGWPGGVFSLKVKPKGAAKDKRDFAKTYGYTSFYAAELMAKFRVITSQENEYGQLLYSKYTLEMMADMDRKWREDQPEWGIVWDKMGKQYRDNGGWMESYILKRRSGNLEDGKINAVVNYPILSTEQDAMGLIEFEVASVFKFGYNGFTTGGFNIQIHDALYTEHKKKDYRKVMEGLTHATKTVAKRISDAVGWEWPVTASPDCGPTIRYC